FFFQDSLRAELSERSRLAVEALLRMEDKDLEKRPPLRDAVLRVVSQIGGEPELVPLVAAFHLAGMESNLVQVACLNPGTPEASQAVRLALDSKGEAAIAAALTPDQALTVPLLHAMAETSDPRCVALARPVVLASGRPLETRQSAVRVLASTAAGAADLLAMVRSRDIPPEIQSFAERELKSSQWPGIREGLASGSSGAASPGRTPLPPVSELVKMRGDPVRGSAVFRRPEVGCHTCHQVAGDGVDFGPKLTEIGAKLGREGLIAAILEPSSGIAFGYEAWRITLRDGEEWLGLVASETGQEILMKVPGGHAHSLSTAEIASRERLATSLMPEGLQESLTPGEFADLIEYLLSLRPPAPSGQP
ncbi:MAG: c-type cytochrome, partial [Verrucomicrobiae bacterium]|nr:c-type cytochrome [Verrucomicrobiae bacterium]